MNPHTITIQRRSDGTFFLTAPGTSPLIAEQIGLVERLVGNMLEKLEPNPAADPCAVCGEAQQFHGDHGFRDHAFVPSPLVNAHASRPEESESVISETERIAPPGKPPWFAEALRDLRAMGLLTDHDEDAIQELALTGPKVLNERIQSMPARHPDWFDQNKTVIHRIEVPPAHFVPPPEPLPWETRLNALTLEKNEHGDFVLTGPNAYRVIPVAEAMTGDRLFEEFLAVVAQLKKEDLPENRRFTPIPGRLENQQKMLSGIAAALGVEPFDGLILRAIRKLKTARTTEGHPIIVRECIECQSYVSKWQGDKASVCAPCIELKRCRVNEDRARVPFGRRDRGSEEALFWNWYQHTDIKENAVMNPMYENVARRAWNAAVGLPICEADKAGLTFTCPKCHRTSHNPNDAKHRYCGACNKFFEPADLRPEPRRLEEGGIGVVCHSCGWVNIGCLNVGEHMKPYWMCHGCIKREHDAFLEAREANQNARDGGPAMTVTFGEGRVLMGTFRDRKTGATGVAFHESKEAHRIGELNPHIIPDKPGFLYFHIKSDASARMLLRLIEEYRRKYHGVRSYAEKFGEIEKLLIRAEGDKSHLLVLSVAYRVELLVEELLRLRAGKFTPPEIQNLCHDLNKSVSAEEFCQGCEAYQLLLYGRSPIKDLRERLNTVQTRLSEADRVIERMKNAAGHIHSIATEKDRGECEGMRAGGTAIISVQRWAQDIRNMADEYGVLRSTAPKIDTPRFETTPAEDRAAVAIAVAACEHAWAIIANVDGGEWQRNQTAEWIGGAKMFRENFHNIVLKLPAGGEPLLEYMKPALDLLRDLYRKSPSGESVRSAAKVLRHYGVTL